MITKILDESPCSGDKVLGCNTSDIIEDYDNAGGRMSNACDHILRYLGEHCGPGAGVTLQAEVYAKDAIVAPKITNDGRNLLVGMEFDDPYQDLVARMISYFGDRVDRSAHDGTTTAMCIACVVMSKLLQGRNIVNRAIDARSGLRQAFVRLREQFRNSDSVYPTTDSWPDILPGERGEQEAIVRIASLITHTASKGDNDLTQLVEQLLTRVPVEFLWTIRRSISKLERKERFYITQADSEYTYSTISKNDTAYMNRENRTAFEGVCDLLVCPDEVLAGAPYYETVLKLLTESKKDIALLCGKINSSVVATLMQHNRNSEAKIYVFASPFLGNINHTEYTHLRIINAAAKKYDPVDFCAQGMEGPESMIHEDVHIHFTHNEISLSNVVKDYDEEKHQTYSPRYKEHDWPRYEEITSELKKAIDDEPFSKQPNPIFYDYWKQCYLAAVCHKTVPEIFVGGNNIDSKANSDVLDDVIGSIMSAVNDGVVVDGVAVLAKAVSGSIGDSEADDGNTAVTVLNSIRAGAIYVRYMAEYLCGLIEKLPNIRDISENPQLTIGDSIIGRVTTDEYTTMFTRLYADQDKDLYYQQAVIQPAKIFEEIIDRLEELVMNIHNLSAVQLHDAVAYSRSLALGKVSQS